MNRNVFYAYSGLILSLRIEILLYVTTFMNLARKKEPLQNDKEFMTPPKNSMSIVKFVDTEIRVIVTGHMTRENVMTIVKYNIVLSIQDT